MPDVRVIAAELLMTNAFGPSQTLQQSFAFIPVDQSLRTLSGGQFSLQVNGDLATQQNAAPSLVIEAEHAIRDIRATVNQPANGYDLVVQILQNGIPYGASLTILSGASTSSIVSGANLPPLLNSALLTIDVALNSVALTSASSAASPGRDLSVTIRL